MSASVDNVEMKLSAGSRGANSIAAGEYSIDTKAHGKVVNDEYEALLSDLNRINKVNSELKDAVNQLTNDLADEQKVL